MPEGDSVARAAARLRPLVGVPLREVDGSPSVRARADRLVGRRVEAIRTQGKHLMLDVEGGLTVHVWLGMPGRWIVRRNDGSGAEREGEWDGTVRDRGAVRLRLVTADHTAECLSAPTVEVDRRVVIDRALRRLGPDVLADVFDVDEYLARASKLDPATAVSDLLLDQRVLAGVGNEYKSEILFEERLHPDTPVSLLTVDGLRALADTAARLMRPNAVRRGRRVTTGDRARPTWVYDRAGHPCRRCGTGIVAARLGRGAGRITFWCPACQPVRPAP